MAFNRSLAVKSQWRDRKGRWVEMGRGVRFYNPVSGKYEVGTFEGPTSDGKAKIKLKNGKTITAPKSAVESYTVKARLSNLGKKLKKKKASLSKAGVSQTPTQKTFSPNSSNFKDISEVLPGENYIKTDPKSPSNINPDSPLKTRGDSDEVMDTNYTEWMSPEEMLSSYSKLSTNPEPRLKKNLSPSATLNTDIRFKDGSEKRVQGSAKSVLEDSKNNEGLNKDINYDDIESVRLSATSKEKTKASLVYTPDEEELETLASDNYGNISKSVQDKAETATKPSTQEYADPFDGAEYNDEGNLVINPKSEQLNKDGAKPGDTFYIPAQGVDFKKNDSNTSNILKTEEDGIPASGLITENKDGQVTFLDDSGNEHTVPVSDLNVYRQNIASEDEAIEKGIISQEKYAEKAPIPDPYEPTDPQKTNFGPLGASNPQRIKNDTLPKDYPTTSTETPEPSTPETSPASPLDAYPDITKNTPEALPGEKFAPTQEQQDVIDAVLSGKNVKVSAKAGAGKTSTLEALSRRIEKNEPDSRALYIAFNKSVQTEAEDRMPSNVEPRTGHSLAYQWASKDKEAKVLIQKQSKKGDYKNFSPVTRNSDIAKLLDIEDLPDGVKNDDDNKKSSSLTSGVIETVKNFQNSADDSINSSHLPDRFADFSEEEKAYAVDKANAYWNDLFSPSGKLAPNFDTYRKAWALSKPDLSSPSKGGGKKKANILYIDEAQDTPPVLAKVVADQNMRKVIVGDASQAIYGFTGAKDYLSEASADLELPLTQSFRFGPEVADAGNRFLQLIGDKHRVVGGGPESKITRDMENPDAILVRTNRGLIQESINELKKDRVVAVPKGTKANLTSLVDSVVYLKGGFGNNKPKNMHEDLASFDKWDDVYKEIEASGNQGLKNTAALFDNMDIDGETGLDALFTLKDRLKTIKEPGDASSKVALKEDDNSLTLKDTGKIGWNNSPIQQLSMEYAKSNGAKVPYTKGDFKAYQNNLENAGGISTRGWTKKSEGSWEFTGTTEQLEKEKEFINKEFLGNGDVMISTAHKSKGLEWDRVKIGDDFGIPEEDPDTGEMVFPSKDELMLDYVSVTRAKKELDPGSLDWVYDFTDENGGAPSEKQEDSSSDLPQTEDDSSSTSTDLDMTEDVEESNIEEETGEAETPEGTDSNVPETPEPSDTEETEEEEVTPAQDSAEEQDQKKDRDTDLPDTESEAESELDPSGNAIPPADLQPGDVFEDSEGNTYTTEKVAKNGIVLAKDDDGEMEPFFPEDIYNSKSKDDVEKNPDSRQRSLNEPPRDDDDSLNKPSGGGPGAPPAPVEPPLPSWIPGDVNKPGEGGPEDTTPATTPTSPETPGESLPDGTDINDLPSSDDSTSPSEAPTAPDADEDTLDDGTLLYGPGTYDERDQNIPSVDLLKKFANKQSGSNPGGFYEDPETGRQFYVKEAKDKSHALNEALASKFYSEAGIPNAEQHARLLPSGKWGTVSEVVPDPQSDLYDHIKDGDQQYLDQIRSGFAVDAWLANWDVAGLDYDNIVTDENGQPVRIDPGGALLYRAQGQPKGNAFGDDATEWESLRGETSMNSTATPIFEDMTDQQLFDSASKVMAFSDEDIDNIVDSLFSDGGSDPDTIKERLKARRDSIKERADQLDVSDDYKSQEAQSQEFVDSLDTTQSDLADALSNEPGIKGEDDSKTWDYTPAFMFNGDQYDPPPSSVPGYTTTGGYTDQAKDALNNYMFSSNTINAVLRGDEEYFNNLTRKYNQEQSDNLRDSAKQDIFGLKTVMATPSDSESGQDEIVYRGMGLKKATQDNPALAEYFNALANPGSLIHNGGFTSTTTDEAIANGFSFNTSDIDAINVDGNEVPGGAFLEIKLHPTLKRHKIDYDALGNMFKEDETILDTDAIFVVTDSELVGPDAVNGYTRAKITAYPKSALTDGTLQKDFPEYDFPTIGKDGNDGAGEESGDSTDSSEIPAPATDGEGLGQAKDQSITKEQLTDGSIDFQPGDVITHTQSGTTRHATKHDDGTWTMAIEGESPSVFEDEADIQSMFNILDKIYPDTPEITYYKKSESSEDITPGDVVTTKDGDEVKVTDTNPEDDSYVGEILDESGQPDPTAAPKNFDGEDVDHKGADDSEELEDWEKALMEGVDDSQDSPAVNINNYEPKPSDAKPNKNQVDTDNNPLDKNGKPIKKGSQVQLHKASGELWIEGTVESISKDKKRIKVKDHATGKASYRLPHKITVVDSEEADPIAPKPPMKTEQKVSDALANLEDGSLINVTNNDKSFEKNTNDNGDPVIIDQDTNQANEIPEFIEDNSETEVETGVAYSNLQFVPESSETSTHSQDEEDGETPEGYPDNMGIDSKGFQYIRSADNEKMFVGDYVTNKKGEMVGKIIAFDGGKLFGKRIRIERPDGLVVARKPHMVKLYKDETLEPAPTSIDEILDDPLLDTPEAEEGGPKYESMYDASIAYQNGEISVEEFKEIISQLADDETSADTAPEEDAGPVNEQTTEPEVLPVTFDILPPEERGASGDGYHASGPWGKFGASGMMIQAKDPNTGENKYLLTQRSQSLSSNKGKWQLPGGAKDEFETDYQGAARETSEELGLEQIDLDTLQYVADNIYDNGQGWTYNNIAVTSPTMYDVVPQDSESSDAKWFTAAELQQMKNQGDLVPAFAENIDTLLESYGYDNNSISDTPTPSESDSEAPTGVEGIDFALDMNGNSFSVGDMVDWPAQKKSGTVNAVMSADKVHVIFGDGSSKNLNPKKKLKSIQKSEEQVSALEGSDKPTPPDTSDLDAQIAEIDKKFALGIPTQEILDDIEYMYDVEKKHASTKNHYSESKYFKMHGDQLKEDNTDLGAVEGAANILNQKYLLSDDMHKKITKKVMDIESSNSEDKAQHSALTNQKKQALSEYETELKAWNKANGIKINTKLGSKVAPLSNEAEQDLNPSSWNESLPGTSNLDASLAHFENDIASRSNGVGILMDTQEVEHQEMRVNRLIDKDDNDVHRTTFRVSGDKIDEFLNKFKGKFGSNITSDMYKVLRQKIQTDGQLKEYDDAPLGMKFSYGKKFTATLPDGTKISYSIDEDSNHKDSTSGSAVRADYDGLVQIDTPVNGGSEAIQNALNEFGITEARPTNVDDLKREAAKLLFNQINGFKGYFAETPSDDQLNKFLKKLEKDTGIKLSDVQMSRDNLGTNKLMLTKDGLEKLKNTYKVPKTYTHKFSGGPEDLAKNLSGKTPGLVSSKQRFASGIQSGGISVYTDTTYGSNAYVFMRPSNSEYKPGLHLNSDIVFRHLKQVHSNNDNYGKPKMKAKPWKDQSDNSDWFSGSAETEVVSTLDVSAWKYYVVSSIYEKNNTVDLLKKHGTYTINGIPVEEFVVVEGGPLPQYDDSMLDYSGDENATIIPDGPIGGV